MANDFLCSRIPTLEALIIAYDDALLALAQGAQSYTLDTGQSRQTVTRGDVGSLRKTRETLYNDYAMLCARCPKPGTAASRSIIARPDF